MARTYQPATPLSDLLPEDNEWKRFLPFPPRQVPQPCCRGPTDARRQIDLAARKA
jgi:hypothetical protein